MNKFILLFVVSFISLPVLAEHFTFRVPVKLENLHTDVTNYKVTCKVMNASNALIGSGNSSHRLTQGNATNTVLIKFNASTGKDPAEGTKYKCYVDLVARGNYGIFANTGFFLRYNNKFDPDLESATQIVTDDL